MIREIGTRPPGLMLRTLPATDETIAYLNGRELFRLSSAQMVSATEVIIDWRDLDAGDPLQRHGGAL